jgi:DNA-binding SARP family transcriptional activator
MHRRRARSSAARAADWPPSLHTAETLGRALENRGRFDDAALLYERVLEGEHGLELAYAGLIRCALGAGRHADGLRLFYECRSRMRADLGEEPGCELERLYACLASGAKLSKRRARLHR